MTDTEWLKAYRPFRWPRGKALVLFERDALVVRLMLNADFAEKAIGTLRDAGIFPALPTNAELASDPVELNR